MTRKTYHQRTNEEWLSSLRGAKGSSAQTEAYTDLAQYLYVVTYNYLRSRQSSVPALATLSDDEVAGIAEDFVQDVLPRVPELIELFTGEGRFTAFMGQVAINTVRQELRSKKWWVASMPLEEPIGEETLPPLDILQYPEATPEYAALQAEIWDTIRKCVESLPTRWRKAFVFAVFEDRSTAEVAELLNVPEQSVHNLLWRARARLRKCLAEEGWEPEAIWKAFGQPSDEGLKE